MELIRLDLNNCLLPKDIVACIGEFDGVHIGHQKLIEEVLFVSNEKKLPSAIITFDPHPDFILNKNTLRYKNLGLYISLPFGQKSY